MSEATAIPSNPDIASTAWSRRLTLGVTAIVLLGVGWRLTRYFLQFPIWGDEAHLALNIVDRNYLGLTQPLRFVQVAPLFFLWAERTIFEILGGSELAMRLLSVLAGISGLFIFWRMAKSALPPLPAALAIGILAVSYYPVRHSCEVKPYGIDLFASVVFLSLAVGWIREPDRLRWPVLLIVLTPLLLGVSYPAIIIAASVGLALLPSMLTASWKHRGLLTVYGVVAVGTFFGFYLLIGGAQYHSTGGSDTFFYQDAFPPSQPLSIARWLLGVHTGNMLAYPAGGNNGASTLTTLFCLAGIVWLARNRRWSLLILCVSPFLLTLIAASLRRYPYGDSARFEQHLAPCICLLAGSGLATIIEYFAKSVESRRRGIVLAMSLLGLVGAVGMGRDIFKPYKTEGDQLSRHMLEGIVAQARPQDQIVVMEPEVYVPAPIEWYLRQLGGRINWSGKVDWQKLHEGTGRLWGLYFRPDSQRAGQLQAKYAEQSPGLTLADREEYWIQTGWNWSTATREYCEFYEWRSE
jgi:hypothetical protein